MRAHAASVFGVMSMLAAETGSVNLGQGFPDTDGPQSVKDAASRAIQDGRGNQYPPVHGLPELRRAVADHQRRFYGIDLDWTTQVCITTGASEAVVASLLALVEDGDEVVMFAPWFDLYAAGVALSGARHLEVPLTPGTFRPDVDRLRDTITPRTRVLLLNTPHNPTGIVFTRAELEAIAAVVEEKDLWVLSDEVYEHIVFDGHEHIPFSTLPGMDERTVAFGSAGKSLSMTGWKVGWATGPADLVGAVRVARQHMSFVSGGPFQWAVAEGLALPDDHWTEFAAGMQRSRDRLTTGLESLGFGVTASEGTYYVTTDVRPLGYDDGLTFCRELPHRAGVVAIPQQVFHDDPDAGRPYVRWAFCKRDEVLDEALDRLGRALA
ncbi:MAG: aminotransferase class I/II-fold pyridoxal phosphate-dependent enzyme [Actinobacteria bacterium]|nr:aminotransferase class I/II-fold pyridoxal phosphate-dependent enzyme [Actinomycetota bacterium]